MKNRFLAFCMLWLSCLALHAELTPVEATDGVLELPSKDGGSSITVDGTLTFMLNATASYSYKDAGVVFTPSNAGEIIIATVQSVNLPTGAALLVYDSNVSAIEEKIGKSGASTGTYRYFPDGWVKDYTGTVTEAETYQSKDADGKMAIGLHTTNWSTGAGNNFLVTVTSAVPEDMAFESVTLEAGAALRRGQKAAPIATINALTKGINSPLGIEAISANAEGLAQRGVVNIVLYEGRVAKADNLMATANGGKIEWAGKKTLTSGKNYYTIVGDIPANFTGDLAMPAAVSVTIDGTPRAAVSEAVAVEVQNVIYMDAAPMVYTISERTKFYDDGGAEGKISENFNGTVTFVPATEGNKIRIDFDKFAIFYNSSAVSVGNQDVFKFYNGREAKEENLIATLTDKGKIIKSTADDGSLTVTLSSKTGVPADGFEATVSQFIPGDMTVETVETVYPASATASAYDTDVHLASVNVRAINTLNPLQPQSLTMNVAGASVIESLKVYALGEENVLSTTKLAGEASPSADGDVVITINAEAIAEGSNYYAVVASIKPTASNGDAIKVKPTQMAVGGKQYAIASEEASEVTIANTYSHKPGVNVREIHDVWNFISTPDPVSTTKYLLGNDECTVTFVPNAGAVAILEFSEFDVYYASGSYGAKAKFEVYSGREADASKLLWILNSNGGKPEGKLKSTAEDGSITIVFNANTTSSYYAGKGWKATVTPFINHDMTVNSVSVSQPYTGTVMPGAVAENFLDIELTTEGTLDVRNLKSVTVGLKGNAGKITRVALKHAGQEIGSTAVEDGAEQVTVNCDLALAEGANVVIVACDVAADVEPDAVLDVEAVKISTDKGETTVENGDPEGSRTAKYQYLMSDGDHVVTVGRTIHFYDDGGSDGILCKDGLNGTVTFVPEDPTKKIRMTVVSYSTAATAILDFYSGRAISSTSLGQCKQSTKPALPMVSNADDGAMFVNVACKSYSYGTYDGWDILVEQYVPSDLYVKSVTADNAAAESTVRGAVDALISKITMEVEGDAATVGLVGVEASVTATNLADIKEMKLWYTAKADGFAPICLLATASPDAQGKVKFAISEPKAAEELGNYYYWITATLAPEAEAGNVISVAVDAVTDTKEAASAVQNATAQTTAVKAGFAGGQFVIGSSEQADYATFAAAIAAMGDAIEGPVAFLVEPGTYAEDIALNGITGTSAANTITFTSQSGNADDVVLTGKGFVDGGYGASKYGVFTVKNTDWVTIDRMTIKGKVNGTTKYPYYVNYAEASRHNTLSNCVLIADTENAYSGLYEVYVSSTDPIESGKNPDFLTITGNSFTGGYIAVSVQGSNGYVAYEHLKGLEVTNNNFTDVGSKAIYPYQVEDVTITGNTILASEAITKTSYYAIDMVRCKGLIDVANNRIVNSQAVYSSGMYIRDNTQGTAERPARFYNNSISITNCPNASGAGMVITSECNNIELAHNTINIEGAAGYGINVNNTKENLKSLKLRNNLIRVNVTGTASYVFNLTRTEALPGFSFANNAFFSTGSLSNVAADLDSWKTATSDNTLIVEEPKFISSTDLHLAEAGSLVSGAAVDYVTTDLDGAKRAQVPTIGAYEFAQLSADQPEMAEGYPVADQIAHDSARLLAKWTIGGRMHYLVEQATAEAPAAETVLEGKAVDAMADNEVAVKLDKLTSETDYAVYMVLEGFNGQNSEVAVCRFATARYIAPLEVYLDEEQDDCDKDEEVTITPAIAGGDEPYDVKWYDQAGELVGETKTLTFVPEGSGVYTVEVTSADGQKASAFTALTVYGFSANATFEDLKLEPESYWYGTQDEDIPSYKFYSGAFSFSNYCMPAYQFWGGFAYANLTSSSFTALMPDQFNTAVGGGHQSDAYAVVYTSGMRCTIDVLKSRDGAELDHVYVTNNAYAVNNMAYGDGFSSKFSDGDYHKVIFTGDDEQGQPVEFYLADFRNGKSDIVRTWEKVDLRPLGKNVTTVRVTTESSNPYVPAYAALDNLEYADASLGIENVAIDNIDAADVRAITIYSVNGAIMNRIENAGRLANASDFESLVPGIYIIEYTMADGRTIAAKQAIR